MKFSHYLSTTNIEKFDVFCSEAFVSDLIVLKISINFPLTVKEREELSTFLAKIKVKDTLD